MPKRPPKSGYARIAQAEEEELLGDSDDTIRSFRHQMGYVPPRLRRSHQSMRTRQALE